MRFLMQGIAHPGVLLAICANWEHGRKVVEPLGRCLGVALLTVGLAGCLGPRSSLGPILDATSVESASNNTRRILEALGSDALPDPVAPSDWYLVAQAGFNYVDDQCKAYFYGPIGGGPGIVAA